MLSDQTPALHCYIILPSSCARSSGFHGASGTARIRVILFGTMKLKPYRKHYASEACTSLKKAEAESQQPPEAWRPKTTAHGTSRHGCIKDVKGACC